MFPFNNPFHYLNIVSEQYSFKTIIKRTSFFTTAEGEKIKLDDKEDSLISPYEDQGFMLEQYMQFNKEK